MKYVLPLLALAAFVSCQQPETQSTASATADSANVIPATLAAKEDAAYEDYVMIPAYKEYEAHLLTPGNFHNDEVDSTLINAQWTALSRNDSGYYLHPAKITLKHVNDAVLDEDNEATGWEVGTDGQDTCLMLITGKNLLAEGKVMDVNLEKKSLKPGESMQLVYNGIEYTFSATGNTAKDPADVSDYQLWLETRQNGRVIKQMLAHYGRTEGREISIEFSGDLDSDGKLDFLIDTANHYNMIAPTLYLSKPAGEGQLLKVVAMHTSVGC